MLQAVPGCWQEVLENRWLTGESAGATFRPWDLLIPPPSLEYTLGPALLQWAPLLRRQPGERRVLLRPPALKGWLKLLTAAAAAKSLQSCPTLCDPIDGSPPGSPVPGILQAGTLEWVAISFPNARMRAKSLHSCPTLWDLMDSSPPGSAVHGIL